MQKSSKSKSALSTGQRWKMVRVTNFESTFLTSWHARNVLCTACDVTSFNGQRQLCHLTLVGGRDLSFHTRISAIQSRRPRNRKKKNQTNKTCKVDPKLPMFDYPLAFPSFNLILRFKAKLAKGATKAKAQRTRKEGERFETTCFLWTPKLRKLMWYRRIKGKEVLYL